VFNCIFILQNASELLKETLLVSNKPNMRYSVSTPSRYLGCTRTLDLFGEKMSII